MSDIQNLVKRLQNNKPSERYDACEQLRILPSLNQIALDALSVATSDTNPDVADAARRALALHISDPAQEAALANSQNASRDVMKEKIALVEEKVKIENLFKGSTSSFYWIAGLSIINSFILLVGGSWNFVIGLGITQIIDGVSRIIAQNVRGNAATIIQIVAFIIDIFIAGIFVVFGIFARKQQKWAFIVGMVLYALDGLIFLLVPDFLSIAFHVFILFGLYKGFRSIEKYNEVQQKISA